MPDIYRLWVNSKVTTRAHIQRHTRRIDCSTGPLLAHIDAAIPLLWTMLFSFFLVDSFEST